MNKKTILLLTAVLCLGVIFSASAQKDQRIKGTETNKGYNLLPSKGDFAIGLEMVPIYRTEIFNTSSDQYIPRMGYGGNIAAKYFVRDNQAVRFGLSVTTSSKATSFTVVDDHQLSVNPLNPDATTFDTQDLRDSRIGIYGGYEWRRGYGRLQGFWGAEGTIAVRSGSTVNKWGNPMTLANQHPTSVNDWMTGASAPVAGARDLKTKQAFGFGVGLRGFVGAEFFFARKMSIGCQMGVGFSYENLGQTTTTTQTFNPVTNLVEETTRRGAQGPRRNWAIETQLQGNLFMMFHF